MYLHGKHSWQLMQNTGTYSRLIFAFLIGTQRWGSVGWYLHHIHTNPSVQAQHCKKGRKKHTKAHFYVSDQTWSRRITVTWEFGNNAYFQAQSQAYWIRILWFNKPSCALKTWDPLVYTWRNGPITEAELIKVSEFHPHASALWPVGMQRAFGFFEAWFCYVIRTNLNSLCNPDGPWTNGDPPASASQMQGSWAFTTMPGLL